MSATGSDTEYDVVVVGSGAGGLSAAITAAAAGLRVLACPLPIEGFTVKQYWHTRFHHDPANRWLRAVCGTLFLQDRRYKGTPV